MSYFSTTLTRLLKAQTQTDASNASGIPRSSIAQYASADRGISVTALGQLLQAFPEREDQLELVRAHLRDEIPPEVYDSIEIVTKPGTLREDPPAPPWKKAIDRSIEALRAKAETDEDVRTLILDLEKVL